MVLNLALCMAGAGERHACVYTYAAGPALITFSDWIVVGIEEAPRWCWVLFKIMIAPSSLQFVLLQTSILFTSRDPGSAQLVF